MQSVPQNAAARGRGWPRHIYDGTHVSFAAEGGRATYATGTYVSPMFNAFRRTPSFAAEGDHATSLTGLPCPLATGKDS